MSITKKKPEVSLVLPCYNEAEHIETSIKEILTVLRNCRYSFEIILIDDKSRDNTPELIKKLVGQNKEIRAYFHKVNKRRGATVKDGILKAKSDIVGFIDIDLEVAPDYIPRCIRLVKAGNDVVIGHRFYPFHLLPPDYLIREITSRSYVILTRILLGLNFEDTEAGYKFFDKNDILPVLERTQNPHWFWDTEIVARSYYHGLKIQEVPVLFLRREDKTSTVRLIPDIIAQLTSIINFKKGLKKEYQNPPGLLYNFPALYKVALKFLFGASYKDRYKAIANLVPKNSEVVDVCCGDAALESYLKNSNYLGLDISQKFVIFNNRRGVKTRLSDIRKEQIPEADYIVMQGSLYQFENPEKIVKKLYKSAKKRLVISESVRNAPNNFLARLFVTTRNKNPEFRFTKSSLKALLKKYNPTYFKIKGGRDLIAVIQK